MSSSAALPTASASSFPASGTRLRTVERRLSASPGDRPRRHGPTSIGEVSSTGVSPEPPPVPAGEPPRARGRFGRRHRHRARGRLAAIVVAGRRIYVATRDSSPPPLDQAQVGKIASDVVEKAIEDLQSAPATSAVAVPADPALARRDRDGATPSAKGERPGLGAGVIVNAQRRDPDRPPRRRRRDDASGSRSSTARRSTATIASTDPENDIAVLMPRARARGDRPGRARRRRPGRRRGVRRRAPARLRRLAHVRRHLGPRPLGQGPERQDAARPDPVRRGRQSRATRAGRCSTAAAR